MTIQQFNVHSIVYTVKTVYSIDCSFYVPTYFSWYFTRPTGFLRGNESLVDGCWDNSFRTVLTRYSEDLPPPTVIDVWNLIPLDVFWLQKPSNQMKNMVSGWMRWRIHQHDWVHIFPDWHGAFFFWQVYQREHQLTYTNFIWWLFRDMICWCSSGWWEDWLLVSWITVNLIKQAEIHLPTISGSCCLLKNYTPYVVCSLKWHCLEV